MTGPTQWNPVSGTLEIVAVNSGIQPFFAAKSEILGFGIRNTAQGIPDPSNDCNPESKTVLD